MPTSIALSISIAALLAFAAWALVLLIVMAIARVRLVQSKQLRPHQFVGGTAYGPEMYQRLVRAHVNVVENLPIFGALVLVAAYLRVDSRAFDALCVVVIVARLAQTISHIASGSDRAVLFRGAFFTVQTVTQAVLLLVLLFNVLR